MEFVALDLSCTGPDPARDRIWRIACVRFHGGTPEAELVHTLPSGRDEALAASQALLHRVKAFLADHVIVAHNTLSKQAFLTRALRVHGLEAENPWVDTLTLSRAVWTHLGDHTLAAARRRLTPSLPAEGGALSDALTAGHLFVAALTATGSLPEGARHAVTMVLPEEAARWIVPVQRAAPSTPQPMPTPTSLDGCFTRLQAASGWQDRPGQRAYAQAVADTLDTGQTALLEAGPGTGKTYGYLVPLLLRLQHDRGRAVVATRTRALQEQIVAKDLPFLVERLGVDIRTAVLKGRENYLCPRRLQEAQTRLHPPELMAPVLAWAGRTETGDLDEVAALTAVPEGRRLLSTLRDVPYLCVGRACPWRRRCPSRQARESAREAQLVIANHALVGSDVDSEGSILGPYAWIIVDEAHAFARSVRDALSRRLSPASIPPLLGALRRGKTGALARWGELVPVDLCSHAWKEVVTTHRAFWSAVSPLLGGETGRYDARFTQPVHHQAHALSESLHALSGALEDLAGLLPDEEAALARGFAAEAVHLGTLIESLLFPSEEDRVFWYTQERSGPVLVASPVELGETLQRELWSSRAASVLTSATLSADEEASTLARELGLEGQDTVFARWPSPFPFSHVRAFVTKFLPRPDDPSYPKALAMMVEQLAIVSGRRGLVLFTSAQMLQACLVHMHEVATLAQGRDGERDRLLTRFRELPPPAVLLGLDTLWEGVDLPGEELELLVVARLPFPVPSDPLVEAECERLQASGIQPFRELFLPHAVLRLRQGVGRLVRKEEDRGVIVIADPRAGTASYRKAFLQALPVEPTLSRSVEEILACLPEIFG